MTMNLIYRSPSDGSEWSLSHDESGHEWTAHLTGTDHRVRGGSRLEALDAIEDWLEERRLGRESRVMEPRGDAAHAGAGDRRTPRWPPWARPFERTSRGVRC
jgi:hypothetical protein